MVRKKKRKKKRRSKEKKREREKERKKERERERERERQKKNTYNIGVTLSIITNNVGDRGNNQVVDLLESLQIVGSEPFILVTDLGVGSLRGLERGGGGGGG